MTRIGINPARGKVTDRLPAPVTVAVLTYLPNLAGYFEQRLEVLKLVLASLKAYTKPYHELYVFDNGSCESVVDYLVQLRQAGQIDCLLLFQRNLGKIDALRILFNAAPGEVIAYNDDDILFYPGWLEAHLEVLRLFPQAGMVSGVPVRNAAGHARKSLERLVKQGVPGLSVSQERRIPDDWEADWAASTGRNPQAHLQTTRAQTDLVLRLQKPDGQGFCEAIGAANHFQFVAPKEVILQALPDKWTGKLMGSMIELDEAIDNLGYLRLSTAKRYTRHLGNSLSESVRREANELGLPLGTSPQTVSSKPIARGRKKHWLLRIPGSRKVIVALYNRLFDILYR
jgi:glycosyltransferase involved in cell wall biosynthesis